MAGLAARESIVMSGEWMDERVRGVKACSSLIPEGGEEKGSQSYAGNEYATPAFPDKHRPLFQPPTYPLELWLLCLAHLQVFCTNPCSRNSWTAYPEIKNTGIGIGYTYALEHLLAPPQKVRFKVSSFSW